MIRVYLDQNVLGYVRDGLLSLESCADIAWVYSSEHFREISRGSDRSLLGVLKELRARQLEVLLDGSWQITDEVVLQEYACPYEAFESFSESNSEAPFDETILTDVVARLWGADNWANIEALPGRASCQIEELLANEPNAQILASMRESLERSLGELVEGLKTRRPLDELREPLGLGKGRAGNVKSTNPIPEIWELIKDRCGGLSIDQFFGFDPLYKQGYASWPTYLGIVACHNVLNSIGYNTDGHLSRPRSMARIASDGAHIAHAYFCDALISADDRLCAKASAIYSYLGARTRILEVKLSGQPLVE